MDKNLCHSVPNKKKGAAFDCTFAYNSGVNRCELKEAIDGFPNNIFNSQKAVHHAYCLQRKMRSNGLKALCQVAF